MAISWRIPLPKQMPFLPRLYIRFLLIYSTLLLTVMVLVVPMYFDVMMSWQPLEQDDSMTVPHDLKRNMNMASFMFPNRHPGVYDVSAFFQVLTKEQKNILMDLAKQIDVVLQNLSIPYIMYGGTLLGSFRHHDVIPWDDDIDILVDGDARHILFNALKKLRPKYHIMSTGPRFKFFSRLSRRTSEYPWGWPYVDISFYNENATHIWDNAPEFTKFIYPKNTVFPTHKRPLGELSLSAPRDSYANLRATYWTVNCQSHFYSHKKEDHVRRPSIVPCKMLKDSFPFVHRSPAASGVMETLKLGDTAIHTILVDEPKYAITRPYSLILIGNHT